MRNRRQINLNTFWSISVCLLMLSLHGYALYQGYRRYQTASSRFWPDSRSTGGLPPELTAFLVLLVLSALCLPFFLLASCLRVGNLANDGVKLGRDHALQPHLARTCCCCLLAGRGSGRWRRGWRNFLPVAQTLQVTSAFLLLLPNTLLTALEVRFGYKTSDFAWTSDVDFLFSEERPHVSDLKASLNKTLTSANGTLVLLPTHPPLSGSWTGGDHWVSLTFINFVLALFAFSVRYAAIFWYTNKVLTLVFALQLFTLTVTASLGFSAFSCLYKVCRNQQLFINIHLALGCHTSLALYLLGSAVMMLSTLAVCEYGSHYFTEKMSIIERRHQKPDSFLELSTPAKTGCQGYVPHTCALVALAALASCKGPVMYDLVRLYRPTQDSLVLTGLVCEVFYMVLWIGLWFALTVKQQWQFRILDYVSLGQSFDSRSLEDEFLRRSTLDDHRGHGDDRFDLEMQELTNPACRLSQNRDSTCNYLDVLPEHTAFLSNGGVDRYNINELGSYRDKTDFLPNGRPDHFQAPQGHEENRRPSHSSQHLNVQADVHDLSHAATPSQVSGATRNKHYSGEGLNPLSGEKQRKRDGPTESFRDYRNSIRSKCDDLYSTVDFKRADGGEDTAQLQSDRASPFIFNAGISPHDSMPTLMSSFRDKVKESSRAANSYRQQRSSLKMGSYSSLDKDSRKDHPHRTHIRNGSWTPPCINHHGSLEKHPGKDHAHGAHVRSGSWTHQPISASCLRIEEEERVPLTRDHPRPRPSRPSSSQSYEGGDFHVSRVRQPQKSHSLPHSRQRQWHPGMGRGRPRNNSLPSSTRSAQQVNAVYSVADQMARLRGSRERAPSPWGGPGPEADSSGIAPPGSRNLDLPHADLDSCPFMTSRATSTND